MVDFISMDLLDMWGSRTYNYKMKSSCQHWDLNPGSFASEANRSVLAKRCAISWDIYRALKYWPRFACVFYLNYLYHVVDVAKFFVFLSYNICIVLLFALFRRLLTVKSWLNVIHDKIFTTSTTWYPAQVKFNSTLRSNVVNI